MKKFFFLPALIIIFFIIVFSCLSFYAARTNPYNEISMIKNPFQTKIINNELVMSRTQTLSTTKNPFALFFAYYVSAFHILSSRYFGSSPIYNASIQTIIATIHKTRFDPTKPYLISGDQFSVFYPRNLGIFYSATLDPRIGLSEKDWENREKLYAQSVAYALDFYSTYHTLTTTIVPIAKTSTTGINIFTYPSDTLFSLLYGLTVMQNTNAITQIFPYSVKTSYTLQTRNAAQTLLKQYHSSLVTEITNYNHYVYDPSTGLVRKNISLSSARDSVIRQSAFYDNVMYWKTQTLANQLSITQTSQQTLNGLHQRIINSFWDAKNNYFRNDLSGENKYSSDWLIAISTGFLDPKNKEDLSKIEKIIAYVQTNHIDQPFPIKYQTTSEPKSEFGWVKYFVPSYGNNAIWSHWGIEYIKTLLLVYQQTHNKPLLQTAQKYLHLYADNIKQYGGYPETYDETGKMLQNPFYRSILINGWVINFEQAQAMLSSITTH